MFECQRGFQPIADSIFKAFANGLTSWSCAKAFFDHLRKVDGLSVSGVDETMKYLEAGAIKKIICYENLDYLRLKMKNPQTD